ncbi:hypothetical protein [Bacillus sp. 2205SS5-2]|uniref:hypothetical protein n=1 Tax=Bacillus sp. 2205SS5-2 TaxID=3109031 RepID=UPI003005C099
MNLIYIVYILLLWGVPTIMTVNTYRKLEYEEKKQMKGELLKKPQVFVVVALKLFGMATFFTGFVPSISFLQYVGLGMVVVGFLTSTFVIWKVSKKISLVMFFMASILSGCYYLLL